jgi:hypothetical protein
MNAVEKFNRFSKKIYNGQDVLKNQILTKHPVLFVEDTSDYSILQKYQEYDFVWLVDKKINLLHTFPLWFIPKETDAIHLFPYVNKSKWHVKSWNMTKLVPTKVKTTVTIKHNNICGIHDTYCGKNMYDMFFVGNPKSNSYKKLIEKFSQTQLVKSHAEAAQLSATDLFWLIPDDVIITDRFRFDYEPDDWSLEIIHVFKNGINGQFDGVALFPKNSTPTANELNYRFYASKKEVNVVASNPIPFEKYNFKNYNEYLYALKNSKTDSFWFIPDDIAVAEDFSFAEYYDRSINHTFLNGKHTDGIVLFSKNSPVTEKEFLSRNYLQKKEWPIVASVPKKYEQFKIDNYQDYLDAKEKTKTNMFYGIPSNVKVSDSFKFDMYFSYNNNFDNNITHVFLNGLQYNGIALFSKNNNLTENEINYKFYIEKKEWPIVASIPDNVNYDILINDAYSAWAAGFIETTKLAGELHSNGKLNVEVKNQININCSEIRNIPFAEFYTIGSKQGKNFGLENLGEPKNLLKINDQLWLKDQFSQLNQLV